MDNFEQQLKDLLKQDINEVINQIFDSNIKTNEVSVENIEDINQELQVLQRNVNINIAEQVLERAKYYCPVKTGRLRDSGHIITNTDGSCTIVFDAPYAFEVHEASWMHHEFPTSSHFLDRAILEISALYNL